MEKIKTIRIGDLVSHYLYPRQWLAIVLSSDTEEDVMTGDMRFFVHMIPGTEYTDFFKNASRRGWIYRKWLWVMGRESGSFEDFKTRRGT